MMDHFRVCYIPGGMGLDHSAWYLCEVVYSRDGLSYRRPVRRLRWSDYA